MLQQISKEQSALLRVETEFKGMFQTHQASIENVPPALPPLLLQMLLLGGKRANGWGVAADAARPCQSIPPGSQENITGG